MRQAVEERYIKKKNLYKLFRSVLIEYFKNQTVVDERRTYEEVLTNIELFYSIEKFDTD
jgi:hypothetical protein